MFNTLNFDAWNFLFKRNVAQMTQRHQTQECNCSKFPDVEKEETKTGTFRR